MIDKAKEYRTRDGRPVRIYATDGSGDRVVQGAYLGSDGWIQCNWFTTGIFHPVLGQDGLGLIEIKPRHKRTMWLSLHRNSQYDRGYPTLGESQLNSRTDIYARIKIEVDAEEGRFDE